MSPIRTDNDDPQPVATSVVVAIGVVLFVVIVLVLEGYYGLVVDEEVERKAAIGESEELLQLRAEQEAALAEYRWIDRDAGTVAIPIERAMELVARERGGAQ